MAVGIYFGGKRLVRPQVATVIDDAGMFGRGLASANVLALVGEATGGEPKKVLWFTDPSYAKSIFRSGPLVTAIQRAYDPSAQVPGAYLVAAIRVNPATQATLTLRGTDGSPAILVKSVDYGIWTNQIKIKVQSGSSRGKKITVLYGNSFDQGDNIAKRSLVVGISQALAFAAVGGITLGTTEKVLSAEIDCYALQAVYDDNGTRTDITAKTRTIDNNYFSTGLVAGEDYLYFGSERMFNRLRFELGGGTANTQQATLSGEYWNGLEWVSLPNFVDGTASGGAPFAVSGTISFYGTAGNKYTYPSGWAKTTVDGVNAYWIRLKTNTSLTSSATGDVLTGVWSLRVDLTQYNTVQKLVDYLDAQPGIEALVLSTNVLDSSLELDEVSVNFIDVTTTLTGEYTAGRILAVGSVTGFSVGDYITISRADGTLEELRRITAIGSNQLSIDSVLSGSYAVGSVIRLAKVFNSDLQAVIDWFNSGNTAYVTAEYHPDAVGRKELAVMPDTYLEGGTDGVVTQADWDAALKLLETEDVHLISCISYSPSVWASLSAHCSYMSNIGKERIGFCGGFADEDGYVNGLGKWKTAPQIRQSIEQMLKYAEMLNSDRMVYVGPGFIAYDENGNKITYDGSISAALVAGMAAGVDVAEALTHKSVKVLGLEYKFSWADLDRLLLGGVCPLEYAPNVGYRVCQSITTWLVNDKYNRREVSVRRTADYVARQVRERLEMDFVGAKGTSTTLISIKNATISVLTQCYRLNLLAGDANNPPFKNVQCRLEGDTVWVEFECSPVIPVNYIPVTLHLTVFTTTLTA